MVKRKRTECPHGKVKYAESCKICSPHLFCKKHGKRARECTGCGYKRKKCEHGVIKTQCPDCNNHLKCPHGYKRRKSCKICRPERFCKEHNRIKQRCKMCGNGMCKHGRTRYRCAQCNNIKKCPCGHYFTKCSKCNGCEHGKNIWRCLVCKPKNALASLVRGRICNALRSSTCIKDRGTIEYLGCDIETFKKHIEEQFTDEMSWDNHGTYFELDHIIPIMYNNPTVEQIKERFHYTNVQPLKKEQNWSKGNRFIG